MMRQETINRRLKAFVKANKKAHELYKLIVQAEDMNCPNIAETLVEEQRKQISLVDSNRKKLNEKAGLFVIYESTVEKGKDMQQSIYCGKAYKKPFDWNKPGKPTYTYKLIEENVVTNSINN